MSREHSILIVGGGVAGLATAWELARLGQRGVLLLEREEQLGSHSSALNAAILRTLSSDPITTRLARASADFLRRPPEGFSEVPLVDPRGLVLVAGSDAAAGLRARVEALGPDAKVAEISQGELHTLAPAYAGPVAVAFHFPEEGQIDIAALMQGFARGARRGGVGIRTAAAVSELVCESGCVAGVRLENGERLRAATTVIAAGGWAGALGRAAGSGVRLRPTRRHLMVTAPDAAVERSWPVVWRLGADEFYCRPESGGMLLCACDLSDVEPDRCHADAGVRDTIAEKTAHQLPALAEAGAAHFWCGMRTLTEDGRFAIGPDPDLAGLFWVAGLAGAGMVCSGELGRIAAARLTGAPAELPAEIIDALAPARLAAPRG
ncbi:MAG: FAD-binding oxidoreductase [Deltaproteobacteria bacterium]|nr:FAD-binding oxidoreductase [Deltaproteobacteria bacterium]MBW2420227.1 FAD-binding oxidoreductase [Deltaproteobacteria bacterium]